MRAWPALICAAVGGAALVPVSPATAARRTYTVLIDKMKFGAVPAGLRRGDAILWVNRDFLRHTATAADHSFNVDLPAGTKRQIVLKKSGSIPFTCRYHPGMRGVLQVK